MSTSALFVSVISVIALIYQSSWNGETINVQSVIFNSHQLVVFCDESQLSELYKLKYVQSAKVYVNDSLEHIIDTSDTNNIKHCIKMGTFCGVM